MMTTSRKASVTAGTLFVVATAASLTAAALLPALTGDGWTADLAQHRGRVAASALLYLVMAGTSVGIAVALYPVLRPHGQALAVGAVVFRALEAVFYAVGVVCLLTVLSLAVRLDGASGTDAATGRVLADSLVSAREHAAATAVIAFTVGATLYYLAFLRARLVPRWLSGWGLVGTALMALAAVLAVAGDNRVTGYVALALPIGVQEMVFAVWLLLKGFTDVPARTRPPLLEPV